MRAGYFELLKLDVPECPAHFYMAAPRAGKALPPAARPGQGRGAAGRGLRADEALLSCLGEAAELVSACFWGDEHLARATPAAVGPAAIHPGDLTLFSKRKYRKRATWNRCHGKYEW